MPARKPSKELELEIMEYIFSNRCPDHKEALEIWNNNPWIAVSMYEVAHYPENLGMPIAFPSDVDMPDWYREKLVNEEMYAMKGEPLYIAYPRAQVEELVIGDLTLYINKFGRITNDDQEDEEGAD